MPDNKNLSVAAYTALGTARTEKRDQLEHHLGSLVHQLLGHVHVVDGQDLGLEVIGGTFESQDDQVLVANEAAIV